jgi:Ala-tRNA(Pro) deacylase
MEYFEGRPQDCGAREAREVRVYDLLDALGIPYLRADHPPAMTMEACCPLPDARMCKNLFLCNRQGTRHYLLMLPGDKPFRTKDLSAQLGTARLSFAPEADLALLDLQPGSVSVLGLMNDREGRVSLVIDRDVLAEEYVGCHPCRNTSSLRLRTSDLLEKFLPAVGHGYTEVSL